MKGIAFLLGACLALWAAPSGAVSLSEDVVAAMRQADVVILGEVHDNPAHHLVQAEAVRAVDPAALVWEMLPEEVAVRLDGAVIADADKLATVTGWADLGWPDLALYLPVFRAAPDRPHVGALLPRQALRPVMEAGPAALLGDEAARFGLTDPLPEPEQAAREADQMAAHCDALPAEMLPKMVEIQRLRDAVLARAVLRALERTGGPVAVITGNGHARKDRGLPVYLARVAPELRVFALGQSEAGGVAGAFDAVIDSPAIDRPDPCAAFAKPD